MRREAHQADVARMFFNRLQRVVTEEKANDLTGSNGFWPSAALRSVTASQSRTVLSLDPDTTCLPPDAKAT